MKAMHIAVLIVLFLCVALHAQHINLVSESFPGLGEVNDFCQYGDYGLFIGGNHHLAIIDFNDPYGMPVAVFDIPGNYNKSYDVLSYGSHAYLFIHESMFIISLQDILSPVLVKEVDLAARRYGCLIQGNILYIASALGSLTSYNLSNPAFPINMDTLAIPSFYYGYMFAGDGFIACQGDSLYTVDTSDPHNLQRSTTIAYSDSNPEYQTIQVATLGHYLVVNSPNQLIVYNLANPYSPSQISSTSLNCDDIFGRAHIYNNVLWSMYYDGNYEDNESGLMAIDLSNPSAPLVIRKQSMLEDWDIYNLSLFFRASGNRIMFFYPIYLPQGIQTAVLSGTNYTISNIRIRYGSMGIPAANDTWIVGMNPLINILEYNNDLTLDIVTQIEPESYLCNVAKIKDNLLLSAYEVLYNEDNYGVPSPTLDIYNLQTGSKLSSFPLPTDQWDFPAVPRDMLIYGNNALLSNSQGGLVCVDISDPANPSQRFRIWDPFYSVLNAAVHGNDLWVGTYVNMAGGYLRCYDISDIDYPIHKFDISLGDSFPANMLIVGDYLYMRNSYLLRCFHLTGEGIGEQSDFYLSGSDFSYMLPLGTGLLLGGSMRMKVLSLKDPLHPEETGSQALEMVYPDYPPDQPYYPNAYYAVQGNNILVGNGRTLKCFDASLAAIMCEATLDFGTEALQIFPNPGREKVYVGFNAATSGTALIEIYNLRGQKVISKTLNSTMEGLNVQNLNLTDNSGRKLAAGIYIVKVHTGANNQTSKLVVLH